LSYHNKLNNHWPSHDSPELRIVLIGGRELTGEPSNKSLSGNIILGQNVFDTSRRTAQSVVGQQEVHGRRVTVVDTPGWWWHYPLENTPKLDQIEIQNSVHLCPPGPHVQDLLEKIEEMWAGNENSHYEVDPDREAQLEARKEAEGKLARRIRKTTERQSRILGKLFEGNQKIIK
uniref:AIG1-type G domain-containing protein n=1 Tax=Maylandia zebra TaxID=106582 RepID=A0A3P9BY45_9CICH